ncbi:MAG: hypothetical protein MRY75_00140 [Marivita sp.]|nr:hypothetical protein [Marivita sp.]
MKMLVQPVNQALDSILGMAVQIPALKTIGDELGLSMGDAVKKVKRDDDAKS